MNAQNNFQTVKRNQLVSVVITAYNHARYLPDAIESAINQTYPQVEIIVVDDGSIDDTKLVAEKYSEVHYIWQQNKGLSSARNTGIAGSHGKYLVFLDADDMLYPNALVTNAKYFHQYPECGFISGIYDRMNGNKEIMMIYDTYPPQKDHFLTLLKNNYIGMHATVMYRREVFDHFLYDESLLACEDHDIYLKIAKNYPVFSHTEKIASYRIHDQNMSHHVKLMLSQALKVLDKNRDDDFGPQAKACYLAGRKHYKQYYAGIVLKRLRLEHSLFLRNKISSYEIKLLVTVMPLQLAKSFIRKGLNITRRIVRRILPYKRKLYRLFKLPSRFVPKAGDVRMGDMRRIKPFSRNFGYDRGGPLDRVYIENFLNENADCIKGNILEIGDNYYTRVYGKQKVSRSDVLFINDSNKEATIIGDLSRAEHIASEQFDCIILTQTLHLIYDFSAALRHCRRILKKQGILLLTVPGITPIDHGEWKDTWYWSFTGKSIYKLLTACFHPLDIQVQTHGNALTASAFLYGIGKNEISLAEIMQNDPHYQVIVTAKAIKNER